MKTAEISTIKNSQGEYEISSPGQLLYFSNHYAEDIPRKAVVRLTSDLDMAGVEGFLPIGRRKENSFRGTFFGGGHIIRNLKIVMHGKKNVALFGYLGDDFAGGYVSDLGVVDFDYTGSKNVGGLTGVNYGTVERCFAIGRIHGETDTNAMGIGGLTGKNHGQEDGTPGTFRNCYANVEIEASFAIGGIAGKDEGGILENCYAAGSIRALNPNGQAGGIFGAFNGGNGAENCVTMVRSIEGEKDIDKTVGQLEDENGQQMSGILAWDGMRISGMPPAEQNFKWTDISASKLCEKATWEALGWDFERVWLWNDGYPVLRGFDTAAQSMTFDFSVAAAINTKPVKSAPAGKEIPVEASVVTDGEVRSVILRYESTDYPQAVENMTLCDGVYKGVIPPQTSDVTYSIEVKTTLGAVGSGRRYRIFIDDGSINAAPERICLNMGENFSERRLNWVTDPRILRSVVQYREKGTVQWQSVDGTAEVSSVTPGFKELAGHKAQLCGLDAGKTYEYRVGDGENWSEVLAFTVTDPGDGFSFLFTADSQSVTVEDYSTYVKCMNWALSQGREYAFAVMGGDISQDGYKSTQWAAFFEAAGKMFAELTFVPVLGNHDRKGDAGCVQFRTHFNPPHNGIGSSCEGLNYGFTYGNAAFYVLNTEPERADVFSSMMEEQLSWLEEEVEKTDCRWKIVLMHGGPYTSNHDDSRVRAVVTDVFERLGIDLALGGHDHLYVRTTMRAGQKVPVNEGVTYVTAGTVGNKFYDWLPESESYTEVYADEFGKQIFCAVHVKSDAIEVEAWQKADASDSNCSNFVLCDSFLLK